MPYSLWAQVEKELSLTLEQSAERMNKLHPSLQIADRTVSIARSERQKMNSFWYPSLNASGAYIHWVNDIAVKQSLKPYTESAKEFIQQILPDDAFITSLLDQVGIQTLSVPLVRRNVTSIGAEISWPIFTGGKRMYASRIGNRLIELAEVGKEEVYATLQVELVQTYYALQLAEQVLKVKQESLDGLQRHYNDALKLEANGMINKAGRLFAQVNRDEAKREWEAAEKDLDIARQALKTLLRMEEDTLILHPVTPLFIKYDLPDREYFQELINGTNYSLRKLQLQEKVAIDEQRIARSAYLPNIALFGQQTLYVHNLPRNLLPRTWVGIAFTWNLFDGWNREANIRQAKLTRQSITFEREQAQDDLEVLVNKLYSEVEKVREEATTLHITIELSSELLRMRRKAFEEGMATSTEVIDAEVMLSKVQVALLIAQYQFDVTLASLCSICGVPEMFWKLKKEI